MNTERQPELERQRIYSQMWNEAADPAFMFDLLARDCQPNRYMPWLPPDREPRSRWPETVLRKLRLWVYEMSELSTHDYRGSGDGYDAWGRGELDPTETNTTIGTLSRYWCNPEQDNPGDPPMPARAALLREVLGDPYDLTPYGRAGDAWTTAEALAMAQTIWHDRDWQGLGPLADRLEESGCTDARLLCHLRDRAAPHCRGCWALDLLLGHTT